MEMFTTSREALRMKNQQKESEILSQIAVLLVREKFLTPEEHIRFLALLKEET